MIEFAEVQIDVRGHEIRRQGTLVHVEPQVFDVLVYLIERRDRLVSKTELYDAVWGHRFVTESALTSRIKTARHVIGDNGRDQQMIRTIHGKGYRFVAELVEHPTNELVATSSNSPVGVVDALISGSGRAIRVNQHLGASSYLRELREVAILKGVPTGHGSTHRSSLRTYGCLVEALDELVSRRPEILHWLPTGCRDEIELVLSGALPSRRQRWVLAVHELIVTCTRQLGSLLLILEVSKRPSIHFLGTILDHLRGGTGRCEPLSARSLLLAARSVDDPVDDRLEPPGIESVAAGCLQM